MEYVRHANECWWGTCLKLITTDGYAMVQLGIVKEEPECKLTRLRERLTGGETNKIPH